MIEQQSTIEPGIDSIIKDNGRHLTTMRARLQDIFGEIHLVRDVITISIEAMHAQVSDFDPEVGRVLFRCGAEKLYGQLCSLSDLIEQLGGRTEFTEGRQQNLSRPDAEVNHVGS
jgi:hypothetical protein